MKKAQAKNPKIRRIIELVKQGKMGEYLIQDELLFKAMDGHSRLVTPVPMQSQVVCKVHEKRYFSVAKTEALLKQDY